MVVKAEAPLNRFLELPQWWPADNTVNSNNLKEVCTLCIAREASHDRIQQLRLNLSEASFETVGPKTFEENKREDDKGEISFHPASGKDSHNRIFPIKDVPACFAPFTRFNCNVTLVAQKLFNAAMGVSVLCSGTTAIKEGRECSALQMLKHTKPGELVYIRHVMLTVPECRYKQKPLFSVEPFSYGFLLVRLESLVPEARELVLSEGLPFGAILDRCGVRRSVETDRQMHVHISSSFFDVDENLSYYRKSGGTLNVAGGKEVQEEDFRSWCLQTSEECQCKRLTEDTCCTFGRLITIWCDGEPTARVVEILNERLVLRSLLLAEEEKGLGKAAKTAESLVGISFESRLAFLARRCLMSVALCPVHYKLLPRPHVNTQTLQLLRNANESCRLCGSKSCTTEFQSAYTADLQW